MRMMRVYKSTDVSSRYGFKDGTQAIFILHEFKTDNPDQIKELDAEARVIDATGKEIKSGNPYIYVDLKKKEIDIEADPLQSVKDAAGRAAVEAYIKEQAAKAGNMDMGQSENKPQIAPANTRENGVGATAPVASGARLINLQKVNTPMPAPVKATS